MTTVDDFVALVQDELGLDITAADLSRGLDEVAGWDSVYLLALATAAEQRTGRPVRLPDLLDAASLADIYAAVTA